MKNNTPSTSKQRQTIGYLVSRLSLSEDTKEELVWLYTDGRSTRIRDLQFLEAQNVLKALQSGIAEVQSPANKMRRKILSMAHEMNWELETGKVDMARINNWCEKYGYLNKRLNEYREDELPRLVSAFEKMYIKHLKGL